MINIIDHKARTRNYYMCIVHVIKTTQTTSISLCLASASSSLPLPLPRLCLDKTALSPSLTDAQLYMLMQMRHTPDVDLQFTEVHQLPRWKLHNDISTRRQVIGTSQVNSHSLYTSCTCPLAGQVNCRLCCACVSMHLQCVSGICQHLR